MLCDIILHLGSCTHHPINRRRDEQDDDDEGDSRKKMRKRI